MHELHLQRLFMSILT